MKFEQGGGGGGRKALEIRNLVLNVFRILRRYPLHRERVSIATRYEFVFRVLLPSFFETRCYVERTMHGKARKRKKEREMNRVGMLFENIINRVQIKRD